MFYIVGLFEIYRLYVIYKLFELFKIVYRNDVSVTNRSFNEHNVQKY